MSSQFEKARNTTVLFGGNSTYLETLYEQYLEQPDAVDSHWRSYFEALRDGGAGIPEIPHSPVIRAFAQHARAHHAAVAPCLDEDGARKQSAVLRLINTYRFRGHMIADIDPLKLKERKKIADIEPSFHGLSGADMDSIFNVGSLVAGTQQSSLREIYQFIREVYCGTIGSEYMHITDLEQKRWIQRRLEGSHARLDLSPDDKRWLLRMLIAAEGIEQYLHRRYVGQKRFSLEGGEGVIPLLDDLIQRAGTAGVKEIVIGMAHRGRLNVLVNILGKAPSMLFKEFEGKQLDERRSGSGDVKYHQGFSSDIDTPDGPVHLALSFNPSHLEIINPVVEGSVRARQGRRHDKQRNQVLPVLIHGDAAFSGQGVIMETFNMSQARGYTTGGTIHIIINNQIGFTTSNALDARSTDYCTDVAKMVQAPIFHVNGDDPEAILFVTRMAFDYRREFHRDIVIDMVCYRRQGHNEADEPAVTQPIMYKKIRSHQTARKLYADKLIAKGVLNEDQVKEMVDTYRNELEKGNVVSRPIHCGLANEFAVDWRLYLNQEWEQTVKTSVPKKQLQTLASKLQQLPEEFEVHARVKRIMEDRKKMANGKLPLDWGFAETMAYATILEQGYAVRLSGQDCGRGTFFHRHAVLHNQLKNEVHIPLKNIGKTQQVKFVVIDSLLSEEAVLAFEYGFATAEPEELVIWEAQFGDFANGAQVVIDQFIVAGEAKWGRLCGLVMLLPHGYEGQGPEHSSARLERYLHLSAEHNIQVCVPTTPAQIFHLLRRQVLRKYRKPLIIMSPKSLLRHKEAVCTLDELVKGKFKCVIDEVDNVIPNSIKRLVFCSGKVYYELLAQRRARNINNVAIIRIEQLYPFPHKEYTSAYNRYPKVREVVWCQEEPQNQGAWYQVQHRFMKYLNGTQQLYYVGRTASAAPAVGHHRLHERQQHSLVEHALTGDLTRKRTIV